MGLTCAINPKAYLDTVMKFSTNIQFTDLSYGALQYIGVMCIVMAMRCYRALNTPAMTKTDLGGMIYMTSAVSAMAWVRFLNGSAVSQKTGTIFGVLAAVSYWGHTKA